MSVQLVFTLSAAIGSMGELSGHERVGSLKSPSRSMIIGLIGAALGVDREHFHADHRIIALGKMKLHVGVVSEGGVFRDFHTYQGVASASSKKAQTRQEAFRITKMVHTGICLKDYRTSICHVILLEGDDENADLLKEVASALKQPHYTLYFGRKCCPLSHPPGAKVFFNISIEEAMKLAHMLPRLDNPVISELITEDMNEIDADDSIESFYDISGPHRTFFMRDVAIKSVAWPIISNSTT